MTMLDLTKGQYGHVDLHKAIRARLLSVRELRQPGDIDDTLAFQRAVSSPAVTIRVPGGDYYISGTIKINRGSVRLVGDGPNTTVIHWGAGVLFEFDNGGLLSLCGLAGMTLAGEGAANKVGVRVVDAAQSLFSDLRITGCSGSGSIGLQLRGRDLTVFERIYVQADLPLSIERNPRSNISLDTTHFFDMAFLVTDAAQPCVKIESGANLTHIVFDGYQSWMCGRRGLSWADTTSIQTSDRIVLRNIKYEQAPIGADWVVYISHNYTLDNLVIDGLTSAQETNLIYLRECRNVDLRNVRHYPTPPENYTTLDINQTVHPVNLDMVFARAGTKYATPGLAEVGFVDDGGIGRFRRTYIEALP